jgi:hypothetical protein
MPIDYVLDHSRNIVVETWAGTVDAAALASYWRAYLANPEVMSCRRTLVDLRESQIAFTGSELSRLVQTIVLPALNGKRWATALVVAAPEQFGTSRQYHVFAEAYSADSIFYDLRSAEDWLIRQRPDGPPFPG